VYLCTENSQQQHWCRFWGGQKNLLHRWLSRITGCARRPLPVSFIIIK